MIGRMSSAPEPIPRRTFARALAGFGTAGLVTRARAVRAEDKGAVTVWTWQDSVGVKALEDAASAFNASRNDIQVTVVRRVDIYSSTQLILTIREGMGPDLCIGGRGILAERDAVGIWDDLSPYIAGASPAIELDQDFQPFAVREVRLGDRVVGVPLETTVRVLAMNRTMLTTAGMDLTEWNPDRGPVTFDRLAEVAQELNRKNAQGAYEQVGYIPGFGEGTPYQYLHAWGADYFDEGQCTFTIDTPQAQGAVGWVRSFLQRGDTEALNAFLMTRAGVAVAPDMPFLQDGIAFALLRDTDVQAIAQVNPDFDAGATFVPIPASGATSRSWATGNAISLLTGSRNPEAAVQFIAYLTSAEVLEPYCLALGSLPSRKHVSPAVLKALARLSFVTDQVLGTAVGSPSVPIASHFQDLLFEAWGDMVSGKAEVAAGLNDLQTQADQALIDDGEVCS